MSEENQEEKTEQPTGRRVSQAREQGNVAHSHELSQVIGMFAAFYALKNITPELWKNIQILVKHFITFDTNKKPLDLEILQTEFYYILYLILPQILLLMLIAAFFGAGCSALQTNFLWSWQMVKPKFNMINPMAGISRIFSINNVVNIGKQLVKLAIIGPIAYYAFFDNLSLFIRMIDIPLSSVMSITSNLITVVFKKIIFLLFILAVIDYMWTKYRTHKGLMMSKQEIKEEQKSVEGDETVRRKIISLGLQRARERMMQSIPKADVIITNPTHIAVALSYSAENGGAPRVVAKGQGHLAARIREIGAKHGVPIIERKPLARALFKTVEVGSEIPHELFRAVAEILAYVYKLKGKNPLKGNR